MNKDNQLEVLKETEKVIVDLVTLLNFQWEVLVAQLGSICDQICDERDRIFPISSGLFLK